MDGVINNNMPRQRRANGDGYKTEIFIHRTNMNGTASGNVSTGCLLLTPKGMEGFQRQFHDFPVNIHFKVVIRRRIN